mmetsp:Transcript_12144/g.14815  ORF Transcript_12144/g.14815 Transcript_12144/m.14815 type:complete len:308 (+) Transcript_12144:110-1033(+)
MSLIDSNALEDTRQKANLRVLQRIDRSIVEIMGSATHVVLYEFQDASQQWEKCDCEGSLFVVKRDLSAITGNDVETNSRFKIVILNRNSTENMEISLTATFQMQIREPYLIFRDSSMVTTPASEGGKIRGVWFHNDDERSKIGALLDRVVQNVASVASLEKKHLNDSANASEVLEQKKLGKKQLQQKKLDQKGVNLTHVDGHKIIDTADAAAVLLSPLSISNSTNTESNVPKQQQHVAQQQQTYLNNNVLDKKSLQLSLLSLIQDERFLDLIHAQYIKVTHARASRDSSRSSVDTKSGNTSDIGSKR